MNRPEKEDTKLRDMLANLHRQIGDIADPAVKAVHETTLAALCQIAMVPHPSHLKTWPISRSEPGETK